MLQFLPERDETVVFAGAPCSIWLRWLQSNVPNLPTLKIIHSASALLLYLRDTEVDQVIIEDGAMQLTGYELALAIRYASTVNIATKITILTNRMPPKSIDPETWIGNVEIVAAPKDLDEFRPPISAARNNV